MHPEAVDQNTVTDPDVPDGGVNSLSEDLIQGLKDGGNRELVEDGVGDTIDCGLYDTTEVLEGVDFQYVYHLAIKRDQDRVFVDRMGAWQYSAPQPVQ